MKTRTDARASVEYDFLLRVARFGVRVLLVCFRVRISEVAKEAHNNVNLRLQKTKRIPNLTPHASEHKIRSSKLYIIEQLAL